jgi:hypothetical protein
VVDDSINFLGHCHHVADQLFDEAVDLLPRRGVAQTLLSACFKANHGLKSVLAIFSVHLRENELHSFLVDPDLSLDHHVVDQADKNA